MQLPVWSLWLGPGLLVSCTMESTLMSFSASHRSVGLPSPWLQAVRPDMVSVPMGHVSPLPEELPSGCICWLPHTPGLRAFALHLRSVYALWGATMSF